MRKILLASAGVMVMSAGMAYAACIPTPSCSSLGYESSSSCEGGIKCPFGNAWNCTLANKVIQLENKVTTIINNQGGDNDSSGNLPSSGVSCSACSAGNFVCSNGCFPRSVVVGGDGNVRSDCIKYVVSKTNNTCTAYKLPPYPQTRVAYESNEWKDTYYMIQPYINILKQAVPMSAINVPDPFIRSLYDAGTYYAVETFQVTQGRIVEGSYRIPKSDVNLTPSSTSIEYNGRSLLFAKVETETFN